MLKILKGDEDCWSTKSNPDWRQTDLWYITKANRLPRGLNFARFLFFLWESIPYLKRWLSFGGQFLLGQISRTFIRVQRKDQKVSDTHGWHSGRSAVTMRDCLTNEKCSWRSVWEVLKCLRACFKVLNLSNQVSVRSSKSKKRWETAEKKHAHKAHCLHFRGQHSQINTGPLWAINACEVKQDAVSLNLQSDYLENFTHKSSS